MKKIVFILFVIGVFFTAVGMSFADAPISAVRDLPEYADAGEVFEVRVSLDVDESQNINNYRLVETISEGLVPDDENPTYYYDEDTRTLTWLVIDGLQGESIGDKTHSYKLKAEKAGNYGIYGYIRNLQGTMDVEIEIMNIIVKDGCVEDWVCEEWSECTKGFETRLCKEMNECDYPLEKPEDRRECVETETSDSTDTDSSDSTDDEADDDSSASSSSSSGGSTGVVTIVENDNEDDSEIIADTEGEDNEDSANDEPESIRKNASSDEGNATGAASGDGGSITGDVVANPETVDDSADGVVANATTNIDEANTSGLTIPIFTRALIFVLIIEIIIIGARKGKEFFGIS